MINSSNQYLQISELGEDENQQNDNIPTNFPSRFSFTQNEPTVSNEMEIEGIENDSNVPFFENKFENLLNPRQFRTNISICFHYLANKLHVQRTIHKLNSNFTSDESILIYGRNLCENSQSVRLLKFFLLTITSILVTHHLIRLVVSWQTYLFGFSHIQLLSNGRI